MKLGINLNVGTSKFVSKYYNLLNTKFAIILGKSPKYNGICYLVNIIYTV